MQFPVIRLSDRSSRRRSIRLVMFFALFCVVGSDFNLRAQEVPVDPVAFSSMKWRGIGPFRGGRSVTSTGVVGNPLTYYMGTVGGGVWKTEDAGTTWRNITDGQLGTSSVGAIAVAESDPNVVYVGMGEHAIRGVMTSHGDLSLIHISEPTRPY